VGVELRELRGKKGRIGEVTREVKEKERVRSGGVVDSRGGMGGREA